MFCGGPDVLCESGYAPGASMTLGARAPLSCLLLGAVLACSGGGGAGGGGSSGAASPTGKPPSEELVQAARAEAQAGALAFLLMLQAADDEARRAAEARVDPAREPDVIYVATPEPVIEKMLELAEVEADDVVYDLGCGDGRIVIAAARRFGARAWGFDIDPVRVAEARANAEAAGVSHLVTIEQRDIFTLDLSPASVVTLYLLPELNVRLIPQLQQLAPGSRIVSHDFDMQGVAPLEHVTLRAGDRPAPHQIYKWTTPFEVVPPG
jgi:SAM-dependent methyltransferase